MKKGIVITAAILAFVCVGAIQPQAKMYGTNATSVSTSGAAAVILIAGQDTPVTYQHFQLINMGSYGGYVALDGVNFNIFIPPGPSSVQIDTSFQVTTSILIERDPAVGADMTGVRAVCY